MTPMSWSYVDPSGTSQGPFDTATMRAWVEAGYFPADLMVVENGGEPRGLQSIQELSGSSRPSQEDAVAVPEKSEGSSVIDELFAGLSLGEEAKKKKGAGRKKGSSEAGRVAWQAFSTKQQGGATQSSERGTSGGGGEKGEEGQGQGGGRTANGAGTGLVERPENAARIPLSFKLSKGGSKGLRKGGKTKHRAAATTVTTASVSVVPATTEEPCRRRRRRLLYAVVDTSTWIDEAFRLTSGPDQCGFLQGLATTEVKIVLPSQVVRELDGLKDQKQPPPALQQEQQSLPQPPRPASTSGGGGHQKQKQKRHQKQKQTQKQKEHQPPPLQHQHQHQLSDTAIRARRAIAALRDAQRCGQEIPPSSVSTSTAAPISPFIVPEMGWAAGPAPEGEMAADRRILACALRLRSKLGEREGSAATAAGGDPPSPLPPHAEVVLVTSDINLQLLAGIGGSSGDGDGPRGDGGGDTVAVAAPPKAAAINDSGPSSAASDRPNANPLPSASAASASPEPLRAVSMSELRKELDDREAAWKRAYRDGYAQSAIEGALRMAS